MLKSKKQQRGYALVASLVVSTLVLTTMGVVMYKINSNTKDIVRVKQREQALHFAEEGIEHALRYINAKNIIVNDETPDIATILPVKTGINTFTGAPWAIDMEAVTEQQNKQTGNSTLMYTKVAPVLDTDNAADTATTAKSDNINLAPISQGINDSGGTKGEFQVKTYVDNGATPPLNSDIIKIISWGYYPNKKDATAMRKIVATIRRPKTFYEDSTYTNDQGVISDGSINCGSGKGGAFDSGSSTTTTDSTIPNNIWSNGNIDGDCTLNAKARASAVGTISSGVNAPGNTYTTPDCPVTPGSIVPGLDNGKACGTAVTDINKDGIADTGPGLAKKPIPKPSYTVTNTPCTPVIVTIGTTPRTAYGLTGSCTTSTMASPAVIYNTVHYTGGLSSPDIVAGTLDTVVQAGLKEVDTLVVDGNVTAGGNADMPTSHLRYILPTGDLNLHGNASISGIYFLLEGSSTVDMKGGGSDGQFFGAIISKGTVNVNAHYGVRKDTTIGTLNLKVKVPVPPNSPVAKVDSMTIR